jgi:ring-1,2-phenylacetyl-CoA epoxidase subunit PaaD
MSTVTEDKKSIYQILERVTDPEIPVLSIIDLGIVRDVILTNDRIEVVITPTYTGCPAMDMITSIIKMEMMAAGYKNVLVTFVLSPAWTTDWMSEEGKQKLKAYGIAPPPVNQQVCDQDLFASLEAIACPRCNSLHTTRISEFGSTACKSLYQCNDCLEPFDLFKCH